MDSRIIAQGSAGTACHFAGSIVGFFRTSPRPPRGCGLKRSPRTAERSGAGRCSSVIDTCAYRVRLGYRLQCIRTYESRFAGAPAMRRSLLEPKGVIIAVVPTDRQGHRFDYAVAAAFARSKSGLETVMINGNPETVSTDYDTSDRLFFRAAARRGLDEIIDTVARLHLVCVHRSIGCHTPLSSRNRWTRPRSPILGHVARLHRSRIGPRTASETLDRWQCATHERLPNTPSEAPHLGRDLLSDRGSPSYCADAQGSSTTARISTPAIARSLPTLPSSDLAVSRQRQLLTTATSPTLSRGRWRLSGPTGRRPPSAGIMAPHREAASTPAIPPSLLRTRFLPQRLAISNAYSRAPRSRSTGLGDERQSALKTSIQVLRVNSLASRTSRRRQGYRAGPIANTRRDHGGETLARAGSIRRGSPCRVKGSGSPILSVALYPIVFPACFVMTECSVPWEIAR